MKTPALCLCLCILLAGCTPAPSTPEAANAASAAAPKTVSTTVIPDPGLGGLRPGQWVRAEADREGKPMVWEFREDLSQARRKTMPELLSVSAHIMAADAAGQPTLDERRKLDDLEHRLMQFLGDKVELTAVMSWNEQYDWYFYTNDPGLAAALRKHMPDENDLQFGSEDDAIGEFYARLHGLLGKR